MPNQKLNGQIDERTFVQPNSYELIQNLFRVIFPTFYDELKFAWKSKVATQYSTVIDLGSNQWANVSGETDISVYYRDICIFIWEDKNLDQSLESIQEQCQITVEVKGFAENFKRKINVEAPRFSGVETSGLIWSICTRVYRNGNAMLVRTEPLSVLSEDGHSINQGAVEMIAALFINELTNGIGPFMEIINMELNSIYVIRKGSSSLDTGGDDDDDDEDRRSGADHYDCPSSALSKLSLTSLSARDKKTPSSTNTQSKGGANKSTDSSKRRQLLGSIETNVMLTAEALHRHTSAHFMLDHF